MIIISAHEKEEKGMRGKAKVQHPAQRVARRNGPTLRRLSPWPLRDAAVMWSPARARKPYSQTTRTRAPGLTKKS